MECIDYYEKIYKEKGEAYMWASIGASALLTALFLTIIVNILKRRYE
jgi:hypothetical protein